jgi:hypothetical protein
MPHKAQLSNRRFEYTAGAKPATSTLYAVKIFNSKRLQLAQSNSSRSPRLQDTALRPARHSLEPELLPNATSVRRHSLEPEPLPNATSVRKLSLDSFFDGSKTNRLAGPGSSGAYTGMCVWH